MNTEDLLDLLYSNYNLEDLHKEGFLPEDFENGLESFVERNSEQLIESLKDKGLIG